MIKKMLLYFLCLSLFLSIPGCKKDLPIDPEILNLPTIEYFTATYLNSSAQDYGVSSNFTLSWSTKNVATVEIDQGIGQVPAMGTRQVGIRETTTYILTAGNETGQKTASCVAERPERAILEVTTIPEVPVFHYYEGFDNSQSTFTLIITETNGVGGYVQTGLGFDTGCCGWSERSKKTFEAFGTKSYEAVACAKLRPTTMTFWLEGWDDNNCEIRMQVKISVVLEN